MRRIAVVGGGFSGATLAAGLHRASPGELAVDLFEASGRVGAGVAYSTPYPYHLLNVPAGKMSADPSRPDSFVEFLEGRTRDGRITTDQLQRWGGAAGAAGLDAMFAPRQLYAEYIFEHLSGTQKPSPTGARVRVINERVEELVPDGDGWLVRTGVGRSRHDLVILATGNAAPRRLMPGPSEAVIENPWDWDRLSGIRPGHRVLFVGTGLTMVDALLTLRDQGHDGPLTAVSPRGLVPRPHRIGVSPGTFRPDIDRTLDAFEWLGRIRDHLRTHPAEDWRSVVDALRPVTQHIWNAWSVDQRRRFLHRLRPFWEVHRHRLAPWVADQLDDSRTTGRLSVLRGRVTRLRPGARNVVVDVARAGAIESLEADVVINCTGPDTDLARAGGPLVRALLKRGLAAHDPLGLGIDVDEGSYVIRRDGSMCRTLFAVGPPAKAARWEITAVPDIRVQVAEVVETVIDRTDR
jgi:uncharacterized NAD(P)/FAD-binding protein YdhS